MRASKLLALTLVALATSLPALAANLLKDRQLVEEAIQLGRDYRYTRDAFRAASYKLQTVKVDILDLAYSIEKVQLEEALNTALQKINDPYLDERSKAELLADCGRVALEKIDALDRNGYVNNGLDQALRDLNTVNLQVSYLKYREAYMKLGDVRRSLEVIRYDVDIQRAKYEVERMMNLLLDRRVPDYVKRSEISNSVRVATSAILNSEAYRCGRGGRDNGGDRDHGGWLPDDRDGWNRDRDGDRGGDRGGWNHGRGGSYPGRRDLIGIQPPRHGDSCDTIGGIGDIDDPRYVGAPGEPIGGNGGIYDPNLPDPGILDPRNPRDPRLPPDVRGGIRDAIGRGRH